MDEMQFPSISNVYIRSIIDWKYLYEQIAMLSVETSHTLNQIEDMEFYKINSLIHYVNKYLSDKNDGENGSSSSEMFDEQQQKMSASMRSMKNTYKLPK